MAMPSQASPWPVLAARQSLDAVVLASALRVPSTPSDCYVSTVLEPANEVVEKKESACADYQKARIR